MTIPVTEVVENLAARSLYGLWFLSLLPKAVWVAPREEERA